MDIVLYLCYILITNQKINNMKKLTKSQKVEKENILNEIFNTDEFNLLDVEKEKKEIEALGWNYENLIKFGKELGKKIK